MNAKFKTKKGLWATASVLIFGVCWLYPMHFGKEGTYPLGRIWPDFFRGNLDSLPLGFLSVVFGILAVLVGFAIQGLVVVVQGRNAQQLGASPNGGPAKQFGHSGVAGGPPSVS